MRKKVDAIATTLHVSTIVPQSPTPFVAQKVEKVIVGVAPMIFQIVAWLIVSCNTVALRVNIVATLSVVGMKPIIGGSNISYKNAGLRSHDDDYDDVEGCQYTYYFQSYKTLFSKQ